MPIICSLTHLSLSSFPASLSSSLPPSLSLSLDLPSLSLYTYARHRRCARKRERERDRQTDRQTDRQSDRQTRTQNALWPPDFNAVYTRRRRPAATTLDDRCHGDRVKGKLELARGGAFYDARPTPRAFTDGEAPGVVVYN